MSTANPLVYKDVTAAQAKKLERIAVRAPGVQSIGYVSSTKTLEMYLDRTATSTDRVVANRVVNQVLHPVQVPAPKTSSKHRKHR